MLLKQSLNLSCFIKSYCTLLSADTSQMEPKPIQMKYHNIWLDKI